MRFRGSRRRRLSPDLPGPRAGPFPGRRRWQRGAKRRRGRVARPSGRLEAHEAPPNRYDEGTSDQEVLLAIFEELRAIKAAIVIGTIVAVPLMLLGIIELLS